MIPTELLAGEVIILPDGDSWTPSNTVVATLQVRGPWGWLRSC